MLKNYPQLPKYWVQKQINLKNNYFNKNKLSGFTLIEIVVAFSLLMSISVISIVGFREYSDTQRTQNAAADVALLLQKARSRAQSQLKPSSVTACQTNPLSGYEVRICNVTGSSCSGIGRYELHVNCGSPYLVEAKQLPPGITFATSSRPSFFFRVINGTVNSGTVILDGYAVQKTVRVSGFGNIEVQ